MALNTFQNKASEMKRIEKGAKLAASRCRARAEQVQSVIDSTKEYEQADMRLHSLRIIHRDLKSQNLFLTKQGGLKIGDCPLHALNHLGPGHIAIRGASVGTSRITTNAGKNC